MCHEKVGRNVNARNVRSLHAGSMQKATHSTLFIAAMAASASASDANRTKPKPRLRPVSRSLTTTCCCVSAPEIVCRMSARMVFHSQPPRRCRTQRTSGAGWHRRCAKQDLCATVNFLTAQPGVWTYPMNNLDMFADGLNLYSVSIHALAQRKDGRQDSAQDMRGEWKIHH